MIVLVLAQLPLRAQAAHQRGVRLLLRSQLLLLPLLLRGASASCSGGMHQGGAAGRGRCQCRLVLLDTGVNAVQVCLNHLINEAPLTLAPDGLAVCAVGGGRGGVQLDGLRLQPWSPSSTAGCPADTRKSSKHKIYGLTGQVDQEAVHLLRLPPLILQLRLRQALNVDCKAGRAGYMSFGCAASSSNRQPRHPRVPEAESAEGRAAQRPQAWRAHRPP